MPSYRDLIEKRKQRGTERSRGQVSRTPSNMIQQQINRQGIGTTGRIGRSPRLRSPHIEPSRLEPPREPAPTAQAQTVDSESYAQDPSQIGRDDTGPSGPADKIEAPELSEGVKLAGDIKGTNPFAGKAGINLGLAALQNVSNLAQLGATGMTLAGAGIVSTLMNPANVLIPTALKIRELHKTAKAFEDLSDDEISQMRDVYGSKTRGYGEFTNEQREAMWNAEGVRRSPESGGAWGMGEGDSLNYNTGGAYGGIGGAMGGVSREQAQQQLEEATEGIPGIDERLGRMKEDIITQNQERERAERERIEQEARDKEFQEDANKYKDPYGRSKPGKRERDKNEGSEDRSGGPDTGGAYGGGFESDGGDYGASDWV